MAKKPYLEFSIAERHRSAKLWKLKRKAGLIPIFDTSACAACGMDAGVEAHREDYSFSDNTSLVALCHRCHRVLHMRDRYPDGWDHYRKQIRMGFGYYDCRNIGVIASMMANCAAPDFRSNPPVGRSVLDDIHDSVLLVGTRADRIQRLADMEQELANFGKAPSLF